MAVGDQAAAAGIPVVPSTKDLRLGYADINAIADALAVREGLLKDRLGALESANNWITYVPTLTNWVLGSGGASFAEYRVIGKEVTVRARFRFGSNPSVSGPVFTLPVAMQSPPTPSVNYEHFGMGSLWQSPTVQPLAVLRNGTSLTQAALYRWATTGSGFQSWSGSSPSAPVSGGLVQVELRYRSA